MLSLTIDLNPSVASQWLARYPPGGGSQCIYCGGTASDFRHIMLADDRPLCRARRFLVFVIANEGEPNADYTIDPRGWRDDRSPGETITLANCRPCDHRHGFV